MMELRKLRDGNRVTFEISGTIDTDTASELETELRALDYSGLDLTLDFSSTDYITSAGLRVLLIARKRLSDETMRIVNVNDSIADVFEMTGFGDMFTYTRKGVFDAACFNQSFKALLRKKIDDGVTKPVFVFGGRGYTWEDVERASQIIAADLAALGVRRGSHVGLCAPDSINWIFTFFAIQKLGGIAVLINGALPPDGIVSMAAIGYVTHLCYGAAPGGTDYPSCVDAVCRESRTVRAAYDISNSVDFTARDDEYPALADRFGEVYHGDDAGVIVFSAGASGKSKAVLSSPHNLLLAAAPVVSGYHCTAEDRGCVLLPLSHVLGFVTGVCTAVLCDMTVYLPDGGQPDALIGQIGRERCTLLFSAPAVMRSLFEHPDFAPEKLGSVRLAVLGGGAADAKRLAELRQRCPWIHFSVAYGMSENPIISMADYEETEEHLLHTVGKPVRGVAVEIRDPSSGAPLADGQSGEIWVRSKTMVVCYYKLAVEEQPLDDNGWLFTGDLGLIRPDGYLRLTGHAKETVIRNF